MLLVKLPVPLPSVVYPFAMVGLGEPFQHTPLAVTGAPPSDVILPPELADISVTLLTVLVDKTDRVIGSVVKLT